MSEAKTLDFEKAARWDYISRMSYLLAVTVILTSIRSSSIIGLLILSPIFGAQLVSSGHKHAATGSKKWSLVFIWTGYLLASILPISTIVYFGDPSIQIPF